MSDGQSAEERLAALRAKQERRRRLWETEIADWSDEDLRRELTESFAPSEVPPCRVCGGPLSMQSCGGGPTVWACDGRDEVDGVLVWQEGRRPADEHYNRSRWEDRRCGGDERVIEALRRWETPDAE